LPEHDKSSIQVFSFIYLFSHLLSTAYKLTSSTLHAQKDRECQCNGRAVWHKAV